MKILKPENQEVALQPGDIITDSLIFGNWLFVISANSNGFKAIDMTSNKLEDFYLTPRVKDVTLYREGCRILHRDISDL